MRAEQLTAALCAHGEGPAVSPRWAGPRWVDLLAGDVLDLQPDGEVHRQHVGSVAAMLRPRREEGWVVALADRVARAAEDALDSPLATGPQLWSVGVRSNEGACSPDGVLHLGTMHPDAIEGSGFVIALSADGSARTEISPVTISNGLGFVPDGGSAVYVDSPTGRIDRLQWSAELGLHDRRPWVERASTDEGMFDGLAVDAEGGVWVAVFGGGAVHRYDAGGRLDAVIELPVRQPTAVAFHDGDLLVTTSRHGLGDAAERAAGALFRIPDVGVAGAQVHEYAG